MATTNHMQDDWPRKPEPLEMLNVDNEWWQKWQQARFQPDLDEFARKDWFERHALAGLLMMLLIVVGCAVMYVAMRHG